MAQEKLSPKKFGSFVLLDHLVDGGMATIYRAFALSVGIHSNDISKRIIAIKTINEIFSKDEQYKIMFNDEVKVAFGLTHPNVVQIYSYGEEEGKLYTAMEYISGKNLRQYETQKLKFPKEIVAYLIAQSAQGLDYVHKYVDKFTGQHLKIIHRDISPQNIMLCYNGEVKIVDFGIAKASTNTQETQAGTLKGKVSYLAPEYLNEEAKLDARYDQFALGIVFWELLTGQKLFTGPNEMAIIKKIFECEIPDPETLNPSVDKQLKLIVMKMLEKDKSNRFADMSEVSAALYDYLEKNFDEFSQKTVESFLVQNLKNEIAIERETIKNFGNIDLAPFLKEIPKVDSKSSDAGLSPRQKKIKEIEQEREKRKLKRHDEITSIERKLAEERRYLQEKLKSETSSKIQNADETVVLAKSQSNIAIERKPLEKTSTGIKLGATKTNTKISHIPPQKTQTQIKIPNQSTPVTKVSSVAKKESNTKSFFAIAILIVVIFGSATRLYLKQENTNHKEVSIIKEKSKAPASLPASVEEEKIEINADKKNQDNFSQTGKIQFEGLSEQHEVLIDGNKVEVQGSSVEIPIGKKVKVKILKDQQTILEQEVNLSMQEKEVLIIAP